jgi:hypothetical protein
MDTSGPAVLSRHLGWTVAVLHIPEDGHSTKTREWTSLLCQRYLEMDTCFILQPSGVEYLMYSMDSLGWTPAGNTNRFIAIERSFHMVLASPVEVSADYAAM